MKIPVKYNLRSLRVRWVGTLMTTVGIALTVAIVVTMMALVNGLDSTFVDTGQPNQLIVIREGSLAEVNSYFNRDVFQTIRLLPGVATNSAGEPLAVGEIIVVINHPRITGETTNVSFRGTSELGFELRPELRIAEGRRFRPGLREIIVSRSLSQRFRDMQLGDTLRVVHSDWKVVGIFETGGTAYDSEIFADYNDVAQAWERPIFSSVLLRAESPEAAKEIARKVREDRRIQLQAVDQKEYFRGQTVSSIGLKALGFFIAVTMGVGSAFAAMNMMYGAVMARRREVGTLRALGFRRRSILASFLVESLILAAGGGLLGCLLALPMHGLSTGTMNWGTFSEVLFHFRITPRILLNGVLFALVVGVVGGFLPARRAARVQLIEALRN